MSADPLLDDIQYLLRQSLSAPTPAEEVALFREYRDEPDESRRLALRARILRHYLPWAVNYARRWRHTRLAAGELAAAALVGLFHAVDRFEPQRRRRFTTFAAHWMKNAILEASRAHAAVRVPAYLHDILAVRERLRQRSGREPTAAEMGRARPAWAHQEKGRFLADAERAAAPPASLEWEWDGGGWLRDQVPDPRGEPGDELADEEQVREELPRLLARLGERERFVLERRYGVGGPRLTLAALGALLGLSRERVRQVEESALRRLRNLAKASEWPRLPPA